MCVRECDRVCVRTFVCASVRVSVRVCGCLRECTLVRRVYSCVRAWVGMSVRACVFVPEYVRA